VKDRRNAKKPSHPHGHLVQTRQPIVTNRCGWGQEFTFS